MLEGSNVPPKVGQNIVVPITVPYASGMKADFSDIRFVDSDGKTNLCHERVSYTSSTSAVFYVYVPSIPGYPERKSLMMFMAIVVLELHQTHLQYNFMMILKMGK